MNRILLWLRVGWAALSSRSTEDFYDRIAPFYDRAFCRHGIHAETMASEFARCDVGKRPRGFVLDLGCGTGQLSRSLKARGLATVGLDVSFESLRRLTRQDPEMDVVQADALELPFARGSIDSVGCLGVWRHFADPAAVLEELVRVLVPGGAFVVGYFPPAMGGVFHLGRGPVCRLVASLYRSITSGLGYVDRIDRSHEEETAKAISAFFKTVCVIRSGTHWHLLFACSPRAGAVGAL